MGHTRRQRCAVGEHARRQAEEGDPVMFLVEGQEGHRFVLVNGVGAKDFQVPITHRWELSGLQHEMR
ncbi:hypothetical protein MCHIJ_49120 [Mycolicibacterium chitae]|nr:hypothetical protein MCHIJ_49120 [Mycolicibacterium chitae]